MNYQRKRNMYMYLFGGKRWVDNINIPAGSSTVGHRFGALHAPVPH